MTPRKVIVIIDCFAIVLKLTSSFLHRTCMRRPINVKYIPFSDLTLVPCHRLDTIGDSIVSRMCLDE